MNPKDSPTASERADYQPSAFDAALIAAAEKHATAYDDDDREQIKTDVLNAFFAGATWLARSRLAAATPVVPPSGRKSIAKLLDLVADYWNLAHAEGREQRTQDTEDGAASAKWNEIRTEALTLAASPSPRTPEQPEQRPDSDHPVGE